MLLHIRWRVGLAIGTGERVFVVCHIQMSINVRFWGPILITLLMQRQEDYIIVYGARGKLGRSENAAGSHDAVMRRSHLH